MDNADGNRDRRRADEGAAVTDPAIRLIGSVVGGLPRRDLWLLPLISVLTLLGLLIGAEVVARTGWPEKRVNTCVIDDPVLGFRYRPNCTSTMKTAEGPWFTNQYNDCGYRANVSCGPVAAGTRRIAIIGASIGEGYLVEYPDTIAARLGADLTKICGAPVDVQNLSAAGYFGRRLLLRMDESLKLKPDAVLFVLAPYDLETGFGEEDSVKSSVQSVVHHVSLQERIFTLLKTSRAIIVAEHFIFRNVSIYLPIYLRYGDKADFLRSPFSTNWQERLRLLDTLLADLADRAHRASVPLMVAFIPQEAQVALMARHSAPQGVDPDALPAAIQAIASRHSALFSDTSVALRTQFEPERLYYQVDAHLSGKGQPIAAAYIAQSFVAEAGGPFADCLRQGPISLLPPR